MYLSKSKIQKYKQCKKYLWLAENNPTFEETNDISEIIIEQGNEFGSLIKNNFCNRITILISYEIKSKRLQMLTYYVN